MAAPGPVVSLTSSRPLLCLQVPFGHLSGKQPSFLPWKDYREPHNQPNYQAFSRGRTLASQVNLSSSGLSRDEQNPHMPPSGVTFQAKSWLTKPLLTTGLSGLMQRNLIVSLSPSECQILEGSGREKNTKCEGKSFSFGYPPGFPKLSYRV
ncbi:hypothetical protein HJG60_011274 [Phyllostomus discolor]|uniref:Uncharacterized protein n=1 Tax=Phyllostomus discolor TaxID=89673 RepID=A0A834A7C0_9CHIR|nr:hypothetical protein HJG60_011274 [Phyllostomus discolor]